MCATRRERRKSRCIRAPKGHLISFYHQLNTPPQAVKCSCKKVGRPYLGPPHAQRAGRTHTCRGVQVPHSCELGSGPGRSISKALARVYPHHSPTVTLRKPVKPRWRTFASLLLWPSPLTGG
eukprot:4589749-Prymnesium_polylepis.1